MISKTRGIVLHHIKYRENGIIAYIYTKDSGRQTFLMQGVRKNKSLGKINLFQPLYILDFEVFYKPGRDLHRIIEVTNRSPYNSIPYNVYKSSIVLFLAEILYRSLKTEESNFVLFEFITSSLQILDQLSSGYSNFHLLFLLKLAQFLGFSPNQTDSGNKSYFDLKEGIFRRSIPDHPFYMLPKYSTILVELLDLDFNTMVSYYIDHNDRNIMIEHMLDYYQLHEQNFTPVKSFKILKEVFKS